MKNDKLRWAHRFRCFPPSRVCNKSIALTEAAIREFQYAVKEEVEVERALGHVPMRPLQGDIRADITFYLPDVYKRYDLAGMAQTVMQALRTGGGRRFFDPALREIFPEKDFWMCIDRDRFDFVIRIEKDRDGPVSMMQRN